MIPVPANTLMFRQQFHLLFRQPHPIHESAQNGQHVQAHLMIVCCANVGIASKTVKFLSLCFPFLGVPSMPL